MAIEIGLRYLLKQIALNCSEALTRARARVIVTLFDPVERHQKSPFYRPPTPNRPMATTNVLECERAVEGIGEARP